MEEDHHHHQQHQQHHYGDGGGSNTNTAPMADLRQFFSPIPTHHHHFPPPQPQPQPQTSHHHHSGLFSSSAFPHHYDAMMLVMGGGGGGGGGGAIHDFRSDNSAACTNTGGAMILPAAAAASSGGGGFDMEAAGGGGFGMGVGGGGDGGATARWPRQETLTLLEIRSRLDHKFKEANHKGPLWDEVSRIMSDEHGYQRSGKKCREKFENLYKYYKKTKEGKAGRQDGKHYRFFRQLEALYGESSNPHHHHHQNPISDHSHLNMISSATTTATGTTIQYHNTINAAATNGQCSNHQEGFQSISLSNTSSDFDTSSSEGNEIDRVGSMEINGDSSMDVMGRSSGRKRRGSRRSWKAKIKEFIDSQMRKIMEKQEAWLEKMMRTLEHKEKERVLREEEWRKQEVSRVEREHKFWAKERAWIEARDKALMSALHRVTGKEVVVVMDQNDKSHDDHQDEDGEEEEGNNGDRWAESEMIKLIELRASMQARFDECGGSGEGDLWEEVSARMGYLGHERSAKMCKERWVFFNNEFIKKRKENSRAGGGLIDCNSKSHSHYQQHQEHHHHHHQQQQQLDQTSNVYNYGEISGQGGMGLAPPQIGLGGGNHPMNDSCLRILLGDGGESHAWESYGVKLSKGDQTH